MQNEKHLKFSTCNYYLKLLKHLCKYLNISILDDYNYFKEDPVHVEPLTTEEIRKIAEIEIERSRESVKINYKYKCVIYLLALTGMRIQEVCDLKWADVIGSKIVIQNSKTNESRQVPIPNYLHNLLHKLDHTNEYVFGSYQGKMKPQTINTELKLRAKTCKIKKRVYAHLFRHTLITQWVRDGHSIAKIARIVGHADLETTNHYTHLVIDDLVEVVESHPLLKYNQTLDNISDKVRSILDRLVDKERFISSVAEDRDTLVIQIKKSYT